MTRAEKDLLGFLRDWLAWVERGAPDGEPYYRFEGLCNGATRSAAIAFDLKNASYLRRQLIGRLSSDGLDPNYPFGLKAFCRAEAGGTMHLSRKRIAWVRKTIEEMSK